MNTKKHPTTEKNWAWHTGTLLRLRDLLLSRRRADATTLRASGLERETDATDAAEEESENERVLREMNADGRELEEVEAALARIREGTYGVCEETGRPIDEVRLLAIPWTRYSREAAARHQAASPSPDAAGAQRSDATAGG